MYFSFYVRGYRTNYSWCFFRLFLVFEAVAFEDTGNFALNVQGISIANRFKGALSFSADLIVLFIS